MTTKGHDTLSDSYWNILYCLSFMPPSQDLDELEVGTCDKILCCGSEGGFIYFVHVASRELLWKVSVPFYYHQSVISFTKYSYSYGVSD